MLARRMLSCLLGMLSMLMLSAHAGGGLDYRPIPGAAAQPLPGTGPTSREEMEAFVDGFMAVHMKSKPLAAASVAVVKDGQLFFAKGYGYADLDQRTPVDPARTLFRPGSISKLFTWTAVMQLVEQGKLDLDADIETYLGEQLPEAIPGPITLRNLMTHTAGLEDGGLGYLFVGSQQDLVPLGDSLLKHVPAQVRPATTDFSLGTNASYSNWGTALAGHIVAIVSGEPFEDYIQHHIFTPLGMTSSTFVEPLPAALAANMAASYTFDKGAFERRGFEFVHNFAPAGSMSTTAADMARFMLAHLQGGALGEARILKPETAALMHARAFSPDPALAGGCLGFYETRINGRRIIGHGGNTLYFHSVLTLIPQAGVGLFASVDSAQGGPSSVELERAFVEHYFPAALPQIQMRPDHAVRNARYAGTYRALRRSFTKIDKVMAAFADVPVVPMPDGTLLIQSRGSPARWAEVGDGVFRKLTDDTFIAFKGADSSGNATHLLGPFSPIALERIAWYESTGLHGLMIGLAIVLIITTFVSALRNRRADRTRQGVLRWARPLAALSGLLLVAFLLTVGPSLAGGLEPWFFGIPTALRVALAFPLAAILPLAGALYCAVLCWKAPGWGIGARLHYTAASLSMAAFLAVLNYWNLLGYRFG